MPRAERPFAPSDDLAALKMRRGTMPVAGVLTADLAEFCQRGVSVVVASNDGAGQPIAGLALACRITSSGVVRLLLRQPANEMLLHALEQGGGIAATFTQPTTHRSIQLKGSRAQRAAISTEDEAALARQCKAFCAELMDVGYSASFSTIYCAYELEEVVTLEFTPEHIFVQTPGPGAGSVLQS